MRYRFIILFLVSLLGSFSLTAGVFVPQEGLVKYQTYDDVQVFISNGDDFAIKVVLEDTSYYSGIEIKAKDEEPLSYKLAEDTTYITIEGLSTDKLYTMTYGPDTCSTKGRCLEHLYIVKYVPLEKVTYDTTSAFVDTSRCSEQRLFLFPEMYYKDQYDTVKVMKRKLDVSYSTFSFSDGEEQTSKTDSIEASASAYVKAPTMDTPFTVTETILGKKYTVESDTMTAVAVSCYPQMSIPEKIEHNQEDNHPEEDVNFENKSQDKSYSAPLDLTLYSNSSPGVTTYEWHFAKNETFYGSKVVYAQADLNNYKITKEGDQWIMMKVSNLNSGCRDSMWTGFSIKESVLLVPNVFTPNNDGVNDEFRVSYTSVKSFDMKIFNSMGKEVYHSSDITKGWDGTYKGRMAANGAYYYVIEAEGVDGEKYNKKGALSLIREKGK